MAVRAQFRVDGQLAVTVPLPERPIRTHLPVLELAPEDAPCAVREAAAEARW